MISLHDLEDPKVTEEMMKKADADYNSEQGRKYRVKQRKAAAVVKVLSPRKIKSVEALLGLGGAK